MIAVQEPLWRDGWDQEPCDTAQPEQPPARRRHRADSLQTQPVHPDRAEYARSAARPRIAWRRIHTITVPGRWL